MDISGHHFDVETHAKFRTELRSAELGFHVFYVSEASK